MSPLLEVTDLVQKIEGPYKWHAIAAVVTILTLFFTRFVFKTIKWFFLLAALAMIILAVGVYFFRVL